MKRQRIYPRLCILKNWGTSYGFHLTTKKMINGNDYHYINDVVGGSSALHAGLLKFDRVLEVNGANIEKENHKQIVKRILSNPSSVSLLVLKPEEFDSFKQSDLITESLMPHATIIEGPDSRPDTGPIPGNKVEKVEYQKSISIDGNIENIQYKLEDLVLRSDSWTPKIDRHNIDSSIAIPHPQILSDNTNNDVITSMGNKFKKKNPRHLSKHCSLNIKEKMKILDEL